MTKYLMWHDSNKKSSLIEKIDIAILHYKRKHGELPTLCLVNANSLNGKKPKHDKVKIKADQYVLPNHILLGIIEEKK